MARSGVSTVTGNWAPPPDDLADRYNTGEFGACVDCGKPSYRTLGSVPLCFTCHTRSVAKLMEGGAIPYDLGAWDTNGHGQAPDDGLPVPVDWAALFAREVTPEEWLVDGFWPARRSISIVARAKGGKSLLMFYLCVCLAKGVDPWTGKPRDPVVVGYWDMEMTEDDLIDRADDFDLKADELDRLKYYLLPNIPPIDSPEGGQVVLETLQRDGVQATVFDTFGRTVRGEENDNDTVNSYYRCTGLPLKAAGIASARLDHVGHTNTERARGASGKGGDVDVAWTLTRAVDDSIVTLDHHGVSRIRWVERTLSLTHIAGDGEPDRYERSALAWPAGTTQLGLRLDDLGVELEATVKEAMEALRNDGKGRRKGDVVAALNWRRIGREPSGNRHFSYTPEPSPEPNEE